MNEGNRSDIDFATLEFPLFCRAVRSRFASSFASAVFDGITPKCSIDEIYSSQNDLNLIFELHNANTVPSIENDGAFYQLYNNLTKKTDVEYFSLESADYLVIRQFINQMSQLKNYLESKRKSLVRLANTIDLMNPDTYFAELIGNTFEDDGGIKDGATAELRSIRHTIRDMKSKAQRILQGIFSKSNADKFIQEQVIVLRHGRYTISCKSNFAQYIDGIIHDRSTSGQTLYVEPTSCVSINNELQESIIAESEEIAKILTNMMQYFKSSIPALNVTIEAYSYLVFLFEIANFYYGFDYTFPEFGKKIRFVAVHHPLLAINKGDCSVPLDLSMDKDENLIVVSGPNTGGKTVALKSLGLNHIIGMCGLPIIGNRAELTYFDQIKADIGDHQSLVMDLSTFSAHMTNINNMIRSIQGKALLIFDEIGTGTDPREGAALAVSVLDYIRDAGAKAIITTHFAEMKSYAFERTDAKMYAVDFDYDTFTPTYRLLEGVIGHSAPIIVANRLGFPQEVIDSANERVDAMKSALEAKLEEINLMKAEAEHTKRVLFAKEAELNEREAKFSKADNELNERLSKKELDLLEETMALFQKGKRLANDRLKESPDKIAEDIEQVSEKIQAIKKKQKPIQDIQEGDLIYLEKYSKIAKLLSLDNNNAYIDLEGIKVRIARNDLIGKKVDNKPAKGVKVSSQQTSVARSELVLVGKRVEEALDLLDKYLDQSQLSGYEKVYIVHGRGSGLLRRGIHDYLRTTNRARHFAIAAAEEGGNAVTVIEF